MLRPGETSDQLPDCLPRQFCYTLRPQGPYSQSEARQRLLQRFRLRSLEGLGCDHLPLAVRAAGGLLPMWKTPKRQCRLPCSPIDHLYPVGLPGDRPPDPPQFRNYPDRPGRHLQWLPAVGAGSHGNRHGGAHPAALAAATPAGCQWHSAAPGHHHRAAAGWQPAADAAAAS
jgi:hypothetical protein